MIIERIEEVLSFIEEIKDEYKETALYKKFNIDPEYFFTCGGCGQFYTILKSAFPQAKAYAIGGYNHVITEIDGYFYDINGLVFDVEPEEVTPLIEKVISNYSFSLKSPSWFGARPGPCDASFMQVIDEMSEKDREQLFNDFAKTRGGDSFRSYYERYKANGLDYDIKLAMQYEVVYGTGYAAAI